MLNWPICSVMADHEWAACQHNWHQAAKAYIGAKTNIGPAKYLHAGPQSRQPHDFVGVLGLIFSRNLSYYLHLVTCGRKILRKYLHHGFEPADTRWKRAGIDNNPHAPLAGSGQTVGRKIRLKKKAACGASLATKRIRV